MNNLFPYLIKSSAILAILYLIYWVFLRKEVYTVYMRFYLIFSAIVSFLIPIISINLYNDKTVQIPATINRIASVQHYLNIDSQIKTNYYILENPALKFVGSNSLSFSKIITLIYVLGLIIFSILFIINIINVSKLIISNKKARADGYNIVYISNSFAPFSFLNYVFVNTHNVSNVDLKNILEHEKIHVKQQHTIDVLLAELVKIVLWFNPFAWLLRRSLRSVHEFLADKYALKNGCDPIDYQSSVLKQFVSSKSFELANSFNIKSIKTRLAMMTKNKPSKWAKVKVTSTLALAAILFALLTCNFMVTKNDKITSYFKNGNKKFEAETKNGILNGPFTYWDSLNRVTFKGQFNDKGYIDGIESVYDKGNKSAEYYYKNDTMRNLISTWFDNGQLADNMISDDNKMSKKLIRYYESGAKYEETDYLFFTKERSQFILSNENGDIAFSGFYRDYILYSDNSTQPFSGSINVLYKNGQKARECAFKDGKPVGVESEWYANGKKRAEINHISVTRTDIKNWYSNGELSSAGNLTYGGRDNFWPFSFEKESFIRHSIYKHWFDNLIADLKKELNNQKK